MFQCKIWMSINRMTIYIFAILKTPSINNPHSVSMEEFAFGSDSAQGWCALPITDKRHQKNTLLQPFPQSFIHFAHQSFFCEKCKKICT